MQKTINGAMLKSMILTAAKLLEVNRVSIDALNVFPVPDGDTGTNMSLTFQSAVKELVNCQSNKVANIAEAVSKGALRGARGNSGVILSQVLRGFCNTLKKSEEIDTKLFAQALKAGAEVAYGAVSKPKEGTMLTVARMVAEHAQSVRNKCKDFESFLPEIISEGNKAVELTPTLLPVLKKAGVVDAGGKGLMCLYEGMLKAFNGESVSEDAVLPQSSNSDTLMEHAEIMSLGSIEFAYCTEFFIINLKKKTTLADIEKLRETLMTIGDCVIVIGDLEFVKVHVHTNQPGRALSEALELGELDKLKIENMLEQNRALIMKLYMDFAETPQSKIFPNNEFGYWSVSVLRPLRWKAQITNDRIALCCQDNKYSDMQDWLSRCLEATEGKEYMDYAAFIHCVELTSKKLNIKLKKKNYDALDKYFTSVDSKAEIVRDAKGNPLPNKALSDTEQIPFRYPGGIQGFYEKELLPYTPDAWIDESNIKTGYELSFTKYFYKPVQLRSIQDIANDILGIEQNLEGKLSEILG